MVPVRMQGLAAGSNKLCVQIQSSSRMEVHRLQGDNTKYTHTVQTRRSCTKDGHKSCICVETKYSTADKTYQRAHYTTITHSTPGVSTLKRPAVEVKAAPLPLNSKLPPCSLTGVRLNPATWRQTPRTSWENRRQRARTDAKETPCHEWLHRRRRRMWWKVTSGQACVCVRRPTHGEEGIYRGGLWVMCDPAAICGTSNHKGLVGSCKKTTIYSRDLNHNVTPEIKT